MEQIMSQHSYNNFFNLEGFLKMAFVFRSPRHLEAAKLPQKTAEPQQIVKSIRQTSQSPNRKKQYGVLRRPTKPFRRSQGSLQFELMTDLQCTRINRKMEKIKSKPEQILRNQEQHFFKSKCGRSTELDGQNKYHPQKIFQVQISSDKSKLRSEAKESKKLITNKIKKEDKQNAVIATLDDKKLPCLMSKQVRNTGKSLNLLHSKKMLKEVLTIPSIPGKDEMFGYVLKQNELSYPQKVPKPKDNPGPTDYEADVKKKVKGVIKFQTPKYIPETILNQYPALINDQEALKHHNEKIKKWVMEGKQKNRMQKSIQNGYILKKRSQLETRDLSQGSNESGETQYEYDVTPGPGYYNNSLTKDKKSFRSMKEKFSKIFLSQSQRFEDVGQEKGNQNFAFQNKLKNSQSLHQLKNNHFFMSKMERIIKLQNNSIAPPPGHYDVRVGMENDMIACILRNSPKLFNNSLPRLANTVTSATPGPGSYDAVIPDFKVQSFRTQSLDILNKSSNRQECLRSYEKILVQNGSKPKQVKAIHEKKDKIAQQEIRSPPFLSSSPRSLSLYKKLPYSTQLSKAPISSPTNKQKQNVYPFNSSQQKDKKPTIDYVAQVGLYDVTNRQQWERPSFNVLFN